MRNCSLDLKIIANRYSDVNSAPLKAVQTKSSTKYEKNLTTLFGEVLHQNVPGLIFQTSSACPSMF